MTESHLDQLLRSNSDHVQKLNKIVLDAIEEEKLITEKLGAFEEHNPSILNRLADQIASFGGSWKFIIAFVLFLLVWIVSNLWLLSRAFDPFPFILLNLFLSMLAALQAPLILMSQNRKEDRDRKRAINDYMVNLKAEIEIRNMHQKFDLLISEQMKTLFELQNFQLELMREINSNISLDKQNGTEKANNDL